MTGKWRKNNSLLYNAMLIFLRGGKTQRLDVMASGSVRTAPELTIRLSLFASNLCLPGI